MINHLPNLLTKSHENRLRNASSRREQREIQLDNRTSENPDIGTNDFSSKLKQRRSVNKQWPTNYTLIKDTSKELVWPTEYHLKAEKFDLDAGILESMELWASANRSRMDYYGGLVKKYYYVEEDSVYVTVYSLVPTSTEEYQNKILCNLSEEEAKDVHLLPVLKHYKFAGEDVFEGKKVEVWKYAMVFEKEKWIERTLYTYPSGDVDVPVRYESKNFLNVKGAQTAHIIINYYGYESTVNETDVDEGDTNECEGMAEQGVDFHTAIKHLHPAKETDVDAAFHRYKEHHGKNYFSKNEHEMRKAIFQENWQMIVNHNRQNHSYKMELNRFADYTPEEMAMSLGLLSGPSMPATHAFPHSDEEVKTLGEELPDSYDMRLEGLISPIKDQAQCGSCWAFSSTATVEAALARSNGGRIVDLSEQSLVDCAWGLGGYGCQGGIPEYVFHYILKHGIPMEHEYGSYLEQDGYCHTSNMTTTFHIKGFAMPTPLNPQALKVALYKYAPSLVSIHFNKKMGFYASGIFYDPECNDSHPNHGVVVVGYGTRDGVDYWIIKNSHGTAWGQAGFMLLSAANNNCFLLSSPIYPIV